MSTQIKDMQPGPEMDAIIMQTIFKASKKYHGEKECWYAYDENSEPEYEWCCYNSPSTQIPAAMEVLEQFPVYIIERIEVYEGHKSYTVKIYPDANIELSVRASASDLPLAASHAALLAMNGGERLESNNL